MVLLIIGTVLGALTPSVARQITRARINRATRVVAADFYLAQSTASRSRKPVSLYINPDPRAIFVTDTQTGTLLYVRRFGLATEFKLEALTAVPSTVVVFPSGMLSASVVVSVGSSSYQRYVNISRAGQIRVQ